MDMDKDIEEKPSVVHIQFCKSCHSHNWCTHHNEAKYRQAYLDLATEIRKHFPQINVFGNQLPSNYVPVKAKENKFYDSENKKYVIFPAIGSFEVELNNQLIFSKKDTNSWPQTHEILKLISKQLNKEEQTFQEQIRNSLQTDDIKTEKEAVNVATKILQEMDKNTTFYKKKNKEEFTLTDHFKRYKMKRNIAPEDYDSLYAESEPGTSKTAQNHKISKLTPEDIKSLHEIWGNKAHLPNFIKDKAYIHEQKGKKEMLVNLSSIEEENDPKQKQKQKLKQKQKQKMRETFQSIKSKQNYASSSSKIKNKHSMLENQFENLEKRFRKFEHKVSEVNSKGFNLSQLGVETQHQQQKLAFKITTTNQKGIHPRFSLAQKIKEVTHTYNGQQLLKQIKDKKKRKIEEYIHANSQYRNEQLEEIYGKEMIKKNPIVICRKKKSHHKRRKMNKTNQSKNKAEKEKDKEESVSGDSNLSSRIHGEEDSNTDIEIPVIDRSGSSSVHQQKTNHYRKYSEKNNKLWRNSEEKNLKANFRSTGENFMNNKSKVQNIFKVTKENPNNIKKRLKQSKSELHSHSKPLGLKFKNKTNNKQKQFSDSSSSIEDSSRQKSLEDIQQRNQLDKNNNFSKNKFKSSREERKDQQKSKYVKNTLDFKPSKTSSSMETTLKKTGKKNINKNAQKKDNISENSSSKKDKTLNKYLEKKENEKKRNGKLSNKKSTKKISEVDQEEENTRRSEELELSEVNNNDVFEEKKLQKSKKLKKEKRQLSVEQGKKSEMSKSKRSQAKKSQTKKQKSQRVQDQDQDQEGENESKISVSGSVSKSPANKKNKLLSPKSHFSQRGKKQKTQTQQNERQSESNNSSSSVASAEIKIKEKKPKIKKNKSGVVFSKNDSKVRSRVSSQVESKEKKNLRQSNFSVQSEKEGEDVTKSKRKNKSPSAKSSRKNKQSQSSNKKQQSPEKKESRIKSKKTKSKRVELIDNVEEVTEQIKERKNNIEKSEEAIQTQKNKEQREIKAGIVREKEKNTESIRKSSSSESKKKSVSKGGSSDENKTKTKAKPKTKRADSKKEKQNKENVPQKKVSLEGKETKNKDPISHKKNSGNKSRKYARAKIIDQFMGQNYEEQIHESNLFLSQSDLIDEQEQKITKAYPQSVLFGSQNIEPENLIDKSGKLGNVLKVVRMLCNRNQFIIIRLFENPEIVSNETFTVWLCEKYRWRSFTVSNQVRSPNLLHSNHQLWPIIIEKVLLKMFGSFQKLAKAEITEIFHAFTGSSSLSFRVKEDPTKNKNLLKFISKNEKKNFILYTQKRLMNSISEQESNPNQIFLILSQKVVTNNSSQEILLRMKKEGKDAFWIKFEKFVSEFSRVDVLQLRINHNFSYLQLQNCKIDMFNIVEMNFREECFGSLAFVSARTQTDFRVYLYKEEEDNVLRLVGQLKEKSKRSAFFDCCFEEGKYLVFVGTKSFECQISYLGQGKPEMKAREEINGNELKNNFTEYLPIDTIPEKSQHRMPKFMCSTLKGEYEGSLGIQSPSQSSLMKKEKLKSEFIEFLTK